MDPGTPVADGVDVRTRFLPTLAALILVLVTVLEWRQSRATLKEHRDGCARFAREHGRNVADLCTDSTPVRRVLPRHTLARDALVHGGVAAIAFVLDGAEALDREPSFLGSVVATALFAQTLTLLEAPENAGVRRTLLAHRRLRSRYEVLEAQRLATEARLDTAPPVERIQLWLGRIVLPRAMSVEGLREAAVRERLADRARAAGRLATMQRA